mmetsp:Transcript_8636/g.9838  ORF Transcript_8636/g.9838 Transcript_8636/m.9838 type:complete len:311 (-) Transcript_8636:358-1290(-)
MFCKLGNRSLVAVCGKNFYRFGSARHLHLGRVNKSILIRTLPTVCAAQNPVSFPRSDPVFASRKFSTVGVHGAAGWTGTDKVITLEQAIGTVETVLLYMEYGTAGQELDAIFANKSKSVGERHREMMLIFVKTQLHVIVPFGFSADEKGIQDFQGALMKLMQTVDPESTAVKDLKTASEDTMHVMLKRAFGIDHLPSLTIPQVQNLTSRISSYMQEPSFLEMAEKLYKERMAETSDPMKQQQIKVALQDELLVPCYLEVLRQANIEHFEPDDNGYVKLQTVIALNAGDPVVAQNVSAALVAFNSRVPIMG